MDISSHGSVLHRSTVCTRNPLPVSFLPILDAGRFDQVLTLVIEEDAEAAATEAEAG